MRNLNVQVDLSGLVIEVIRFVWASMSLCDQFM